jgi:phage protein D
MSTSRPEAVLLPSDPQTYQRSPTASVLANGEVLPGLIDVEVISNNHFSADRFSASFALNADVAIGGNFWSSALDISIEVMFSVNATSFASFITGTVDTVSINVIKGLVSVSGRDFSAQLLETKIEETFSNYTSSEIASLLATRHGLIPNIAQTTTVVGRYYQDEHDRITLGQFSRTTTEWDLLVFLALQEGFDLSVTGTTLNFGPANSTTQAPYPISPADCIDMKLGRCLTLAQGIGVTVKSWNSRRRSAFAQTVTGTCNTDTASTGTNGGGARSQQFVFMRPNLTEVQALNFAHSKLNDLAMHERTVEFTLPGDLSLTPNRQLVLVGTGTEFDQAYRIDVVESRLNLNEGFTQRVRAKSSSPRTISTGAPSAVNAIAN